MKYTVVTNCILRGDVMLTSPSGLPTPEDIVATYGGLISSLCRRMIQDQETARDAAQEVWLEVMKSLPIFRGGGGKAFHLDLYNLPAGHFKLCPKGESLHSVVFKNPLV